jgi:uncharacterized protein (TIGR03437 family)
MGPGAIGNADFSFNSPQNAAEKGSVVTLYVTGEGQTIPMGTTGKVTAATDTPPYVPQPALRVAATVDGRPTAVEFYGEAPGIVSGVMQVNVRIPVDARPGDPAGRTESGGSP